MAKRKTVNIKTVPSRTKILDAYIQLAFDIGVSDITLQKIADHAGVAFGTVRYYFKSEEGFIIHEEAFKRVLESSYKEVDALLFEFQLKKGSNPVHNYVNAMFSWVKNNRPQSTFLLYYYYLSTANVKTATSLKEVNLKAYIRIESFILEAIGMGIYTAIKDVSACAASLHSILVGHGFVTMAARHGTDLQQQKERCIRAIDALIQFYSGQR